VTPRQQSDPNQWQSALTIPARDGYNYRTDRSALSQIALIAAPMPSKPKRKAGRPPDAEKRERRKEEILAAAVGLFAERGYAKADTQELADILGVGKGTIYRHFKSKRELFLATVGRAMCELKVAVDEEVGKVDDPLRRVVCGMQAYLTFFADHPRYVELFVQERALFKDRRKPTYFEHRDANIASWRELFQGLIAEGRCRDIPVDRILDVIGDMMYGAMFTNYFIGRDRSPAHQTADMLDIALYGILTPAERKRRVRSPLEHGGGAESEPHSPGEAASSAGI
jgi:AcrR family transcriptional regulator